MGCDPWSGLAAHQSEERQLRLCGAPVIHLVKSSAPRGSNLRLRSNSSMGLRFSERTRYLWPGSMRIPANIKDWDDFVRAVATFSGGRIKYWELWNEPNDPHSYCGDVRTMVTLAQHASEIIKGIDPSAMILSPGVVSGSGPSWLDGFLSAGGGAYVDIIAFHGYWSSTAEDICKVVISYQNVTKAHNMAAKPLWDTEASWAGRNGGVGGLTDISQRAAFLAKYFILHWSLGVPRMVGMPMTARAFGDSCGIAAPVCTATVLLTGRFTGGWLVLHCRHLAPGTRMVSGYAIYLGRAGIKRKCFGILVPLLHIQSLENTQTIAIWQAIFIH